MFDIRLSLILLTALFVIISTPCRAQLSDGRIQELSDGVLFELQQTVDTDPQWMKIQVCTEDIIRVLAGHSVSWEHPEHPSLMVARTEWEEVPWTMTKNDEKVDISTERVTVRVDLPTGAVAFYNSGGEAVLVERSEGGKVVKPAEVMGERTHHIRAIFDSPPDEALYGLGQHQSNLMNYKGHDVDLWQHNMIAVVPFLVSSRNYGILWDNYSHTKFGDIREYLPLSDLTIYNAAGEPGGLTTEYFNDPNFESLLIERSEEIIDYRYNDITYDYPVDFDRQNGSVRWSGSIESDTDGQHSFRVYSSGYVTVWLNGEKVVDTWRQFWLPWRTSFILDMEAGERYSLTVEWIPENGFIGLNYLTPAEENFQEIVSLWSNVGDYMDYYFIHGDNLDEVIRGYRSITGKAQILPKWSFGFWQCRQRYETQEQLLDVVREFREREIPLDNIVQDWLYWREDQWGSHEFDPERYPDPEGMVREVHEELNAHIMISIWPKFYVGTKHFEEFKENGWLYMHNVNKGVRDWVGPGYVSTFFDPFSEDARNLFWDHINEKLFSKGFDAWWVDATEPDLQGNVSPEERLIRIHPNALGTAARYENAFSLVMSKGIYENQRRTSPNQRVFNLTRSAYAGQQRYSAVTWSGDVACRWYDLMAQVPSGLNTSLSGIPYWTTDIGGFTPESRFVDPNEEDLEEWREFNTRWHQYAAFLPIFRSHGEYPYREMFHVAPDDHTAYQTMRAYNKLRYRLMPYIYSLAGKVNRSDYTMMRALVMDFGTDVNTHDIGTQFMFGPALMVNPVTAYRVRSREVYLPEGSDWYNMRTGEWFSGGQTVDADAPYTDIPLFIRSGSIVPTGPAIQYTTEKPADTIRLFVYTGADGSFTLYEDEGVNYNYERGKFSEIPLTYRESDHSLTIGERRGEFPGMLRDRTFEIVWIGKETPLGMDFDADAHALIRYDGSAETVRMQ